MATTSLLTHSLAWALLHSLWQGLLVYGTLYIVLKALPDINARVKYYLSFGAFTVLFLWFGDTWATQYQKLKGVTVYITQPGTGMGAGTTYQVKAMATDAGQGDALHHLLPGLEQYFPFIILLYTIGLAFMLFRFVVNVWQVSAMKKQGILQPDVHWVGLLEELQDKFDISRQVQLLLSTRIDVPMMLGVIKPVILLPVAMMSHLSAEQVEAILLHELAHIKRHDYLLNIVQAIAETLLFFNPFVWLISAIIRREREHCCDDLVVASSASPLPYAKALAILEQGRLHDNDLAMAATGSKKQLFHRIKRIMEMKKSTINYSQLTIIIVAILVITFSVAMLTFSPAYAQHAKASSDDTTTTTKKSVYKYKRVTIDSNGNRTETVKESDKPWKGDKANDEEEDVNVSVIDDSDRKAPHSKAYSYSYSHSDGDDMSKAIKEITIAATESATSALAGLDLKELDKELADAQKEINNVDWDEVNAEIRKSLAEVNKELSDEKMHKEIDVEVREGLEKSRKALEKAEKEIQTNRHIQIEADAPEPLTPPAGNNYESMLGKMENEGLIDRSKNYKVVKKEGELYINGEKQPATVYNKYKHYLDAGSITIKGHKGSLSITVDN